MSGATKTFGPKPRFKRPKDTDLEWIIESIDGHRVTSISEEVADCEIELTMPARRFPCRAATLREGQIFRFVDGKVQFTAWALRPHQFFIMRQKWKRDAHKTHLIFAGPVAEPSP